MAGSVDPSGNKQGHGIYAPDGRRRSFEEVQALGTRCSGRYCQSRTYQPSRGTLQVRFDVTYSSLEHVDGSGPEGSGTVSPQGKIPPAAAKPVSATGPYQH